MDGSYNEGARVRYCIIPTEFSRIYPLKNLDTKLALSLKMMAHVLFEGPSFSTEEASFNFRSITDGVLFGAITPIQLGLNYTKRHASSMTQVWFTLVSMMLFTPNVMCHASSF